MFTTKAFLEDSDMTWRDSTFTSRLRLIEQKSVAKILLGCLVDLVYNVLSRNQLAEFEVCVIGNLCPETMEEAKALVPSLAKKGRMDDEKIEQMLSDLPTIKTSE